MFLIVAIIVILVGIAVVFAAMTLMKGEPVPVEASRDNYVPDEAVSEPVSVFDEAVAVESPPEIRWAQQFASRSGALDDAARLKLINDLGILRAPWCIELLEQASAEETEPALRVAVQLALARCRERSSPATSDAV